MKLHKVYKITITDTYKNFMYWQQYKALMYKNWILWKRRLGSSLCELLFPIIVFILLTAFRILVGTEEHDEESFLSDARYVRPDTSVGVSFDFAEGDSFQFCRSYIGDGGDWAIGLSPDNDATQYLADKFREHPSLAGAEIIFFEDNDEIEDYVEDDDYEDNPKLCFAVVFDEIDGNYYEYRIRFNQTDSTPGEGQPVGDYIDIFDLSTYAMTDETIRDPMPEFQEQFIESGFLQIQNYVDTYILQQVTGDSSAYIAAGMVPMYFDEYIEDEFLESIADILPFLIVLCYVVPVCRMISQIVEEKEYRIKELMMIMGLSNSMYWLSWISHYFIIYFILALAATLIMGIPLFMFSNPGYVFLLFLLFGISCIAFSVLVSVFFSRSKAAIIVGLMAFLALFFVFFAVNDPRVLEGDKIASSLIPTVALGLALVTIAQLESAQIGIHGDSLSSIYYNYTVGWAVLLLFIDIVIFVLLAWYLELVWPQQWGIKRPWNFLCKRSFWSAKAQPQGFNEDVEYDDSFEPVDATFEQQKASGNAMLVRGLTKEYAKGVKAVDNLNLDIYEGQIFGLLGHNGAGKTTTLSMLTGMIERSSGEMRVDGAYLSTNMDTIRESLGICPQQNVLWKELTVTEHLYLFSVFKGMTDQQEIQEQISERVGEISLTKHQHKRSENLSGGQKRKLQLAISLIGNSRVILLDEPTAGMDLTARRLMWDMLKNNKNGRIIILTTHYMQEADVLADRICIMSHGKVRCCGSSLFLKNRYGVGYYLTLVKQSDVDSPEHSRAVKNFIREFVPSAKKVSDIHAELSFQLPLESASVFRDLFESLDAQLDQLQLRSYAVSVTTLEEVFIRVARGDHELKQEDEQKDSDDEEESAPLLRTKREVDGLFLRHLFALSRKRFLISKRDYKALVMEFVVPLLLVLLGLAFMMIADRFINVDAQKLVISEYDTPQEILYPEETGYVEDLMTYIDNLEDTEATAIQVDSLTDFDSTLFEVRDEVDDDRYRMGSYYFYEMDETRLAFEPVIFHNQTAFQSLAVYYQFVSNSILQTIDDTVEIAVSNHPLPITQKITETESTGDGILGCLTFSLAFSFIPASIIAYIVKERETAVKHQHMITGVSLWGYWLVNYVWDVLTSFILALLAALIILAFGILAFTDPIDNFWGVLTLFILFGLASVPFTYCASFFFKSYSNAQSIIIIFFFVTGGILPVLMYVCFLFDSTRDFSRNVGWLFRLLPSYALGDGIVYIGSASLIASIEEEDEPYEAFDIKSAGADILMLGITSIVYLIILFLLEWRESNPSLRKVTTYSDDPEPFEHDPDVEAEKERALATDPEDVQVNVRQLRKTFKPLGGDKIVAVQEVSFNVPKQECFALLGVNGAGKTTTFKMLTGEYTASHGEAFLSGYSVSTQLDLARQNIGYCPQFDALSELMTCQEHIEFYCEIKGISKDLIPQLTKDLLLDLDLELYRDYTSVSLSGGNKRKLSVAISLIGNPTVVFLDEPSAGMDPETRKKLWRVLGNIKKRDSAVMLTTHSMEEAEALCDRMAIMVNGRLRCIGTPTHLRNQYGQGYELELKVRYPEPELVHEMSEKLEAVIGTFNDIPQAKLQECLVALDAEALADSISKTGAGSALYFQLEKEAALGRDDLVSWVIIEKRGAAIAEFLHSEFTGVSLVEHYLTLFKFRIDKQEDKSLGYLFSAVEENKDAFFVTEYALNQNSLDMIFTRFALQGEQETV